MESVDQLQGFPPASPHSYAFDECFQRLPSESQTQSSLPQRTGDSRCKSVSTSLPDPPGRPSPIHRSDVVFPTEPRTSRHVGEPHQSPTSCDPDNADQRLCLTLMDQKRPCATRRRRYYSYANNEDERRGSQHSAWPQVPALALRVDLCCNRSPRWSVEASTAASRIR